MLGLAVAITASLALQHGSPTGGRTILITNDDGLTSNVVALYRALKAAGYDVVVSVPCSNQSGAGASVRIAAPIQPITHDCRADAAKAGDPGAGPMTKAGYSSDFFYVDGTPVMALLYGLDVVAPTRWHQAPDLVLSGPNEGRNVGRLGIVSGTIGAAQMAALRGVAAVALSAGDATASGNGVDNSASVPVARLATKLVAALDHRAGRGPLLPRSIVLNVNFPDDPAPATWRLARTGSYEGYSITFAGGGSGPSSLPGIRIARNPIEPRLDQMRDEAVIARKDITVSVLAAGYGNAPATPTAVLHLDRLLRDIGAE